MNKDEITQERDELSRKIRLGLASPYEIRRRDELQTILDKMARLPPVFETIMTRKVRK